MWCWWRCVQRRRALAVVAAALAVLLLAARAWWVPVSVDWVRPGADAASLRRVLLDGVADERRPWPTCSNSTGCRLTAAVLATTSAARRTVYARTGVDCLAMFHGHADEIDAARSLMDRQDTRSTTSDEDLRVLAGDCAAFQRSRGYFTEPLSELEADFPVAFSILAYDNIPQVSRA